MTVINTFIALSTKGNADIIDITSQVDGIVKSSKIKNGLVTIFVPGSTGALTTIEYESGAIEDLRRAIERIAPENIEYKHNLKWGDGNGHSHIRAALLGPSIAVPVIESKMALGTWQQIVFIDFDNRPRNRKIAVQIIGE
ncbi:MAG: secondary thiamine-phosphate synthase enzyme YjbQ [Methanocellales archaeon]